METKIKTQEKETYITPNIEVVNIETEQNILAQGSGKILDMDDEDW